MRLVEDLTTFPKDIETVVTSGTFDGVHLGHQKILDQVVSLARERSMQSVVLTYWPHPRFVLSKGDELKLLSTFEEKTQLMARTGVDFLVRIPFTEKFAKQEPEDFVRDVLIDHLNTQMMVIGYDHHFGKDRKGNFAYLEANAEEFGFEVKEISRHDIDDVGVSSTKIRNALLSGNVADAAALLGRPYGLTGNVVQGDKLGRELGFPTANIWVPESYKLIPADGSYAVRVKIDGVQHDGMVNVGRRPTINGLQKRIEVHIFNFARDIYHEEVEITFVDKLRDEVKFEDLDALKTQLNTDKQHAQDILKKSKY